MKTSFVKQARMAVGSTVWLECRAKAALSFCGLPTAFSGRRQGAGGYFRNRGRDILSRWPIHHRSKEQRGCDQVGQFGDLAGTLNFYVVVRRAWQNRVFEDRELDHQTFMQYEKLQFQKLIVVSSWEWWDCKWVTITFWRVCKYSLDTVKEIFYRVRKEPNTFG